MARAVLWSLAVHAIVLLGVARTLPALFVPYGPVAQALKVRVGVPGERARRAPAPAPAAASPLPATKSPVPLGKESVAPAAKRPLAAAPTAKAVHEVQNAGPAVPELPAPPAAGTPGQMRAAGEAAVPSAVPEAKHADSGTEGVRAPSGRLAQPGNDKVGTDGSERTAETDGVRADDLRAYRIALAINAKRFKRYPPLAREQGWQGSVELAVEFQGPSPEARVSLRVASGYAILDEQALATIRQAVARTELPAGLHGKDFRLVQEIRFSLDD